MNKKTKIDYWLSSSEHDWKVAGDLFEKGDYAYSLFFGHLTLEKLMKAQSIAGCGKKSHVKLTPEIDTHGKDKYYKSKKRQEILRMTRLDRIELNPRVCNGRPVIKGTRIPVSVILEQIAEGDSWDEILAGYPELNREDIRAALLYARASLDHAEVRAVGA